MPGRDGSGPLPMGPLQDERTELELMGRPSAPGRGRQGRGARCGAGRLGRRARKGRGGGVIDANPSLVPPKRRWGIWR